MTALQGWIDEAERELAYVKPHLAQPTLPRKTLVGLIAALKEAEKVAEAADMPYKYRIEANDSGLVTGYVIDCDDWDALQKALAAFDAATEEA